MKRGRELHRLRPYRLLGLVLYVCVQVGLLVVLDGVDESRLPPSPADFAVLLFPTVVAGLLLGSVALLGPVAFVAALIAAYYIEIDLKLFEDALWSVGVFSMACLHVAAVGVGLLARGLRRGGRSPRRG